MGVKWTEEQQQVIDLRDHNILVSAAAGSGKTAVLVERIIARLTRDANPVDVDHMLIVTYTEAAAAEVKERIGAAIEKELEEDPSSEHLKRQSALIHTAKITTIHSFCLSVIREYFHTIDLDPGFRIAEEGELKLLKQDVMKELLEAVHLYLQKFHLLRISCVLWRLLQPEGKICRWKKSLADCMNLPEVIRIRRSGWMTVQGCTKRAGKKLFILKR